MSEEQFHEAVRLFISVLMALLIAAIVTALIQAGLNPPAC